MALTSTLYTGLSGLNTNQTRMNVVGNNIANSNTVAFKASRVLFKPQAYVTDAAGGPPSGDSGGTNPSQHGLGATIASILSYTLERRLTRTPERFGKGAIEGVAGPGSANNGASAGAMVPLLTLGVPGSSSTAIILAAFVMYGIQPGPLLFQNRPDLVWGLIDSMYIGNVMLLILNLPLIGIFVRLLYIPSGILMPLIMSISTIGIYAINGNPVELYFGLIFGVIGYVFRKIDIPLAPMVLSLVLGGIMEQSFRQAMTISGGNPKIFFSSAMPASGRFVLT